MRAIEDLALVDELAETGIVLEVCPGSNIALGIYPELARASDRRACATAGVKVTVSTDDPPFFHTTMAREYDGWPRPSTGMTACLPRSRRTSLDAAFCDADTRDTITEKTGDRPCLTI